jgi:hypothetical protein
MFVIEPRYRECKLTGVNAAGTYSHLETPTSHSVTSMRKQRASIQQRLKPSRNAVPTARIAKRYFELQRLRELVRAELITRRSGNLVRRTVQ